MATERTTKTEQYLTPQLLARLERMELVSRKVFRGRMKGERRSKRKGQSVEFADFRNYVPGDDLRFIDWNLYARLDKLFLKLFQEEEDLHFYCLLDCSQSMNFGRPTKLYYGKQLAAALGYVGLCHSDRVKISALNSGQSAEGPVLRGKNSLWQLYGFLDSLGPDETADAMVDGLKSFCLRNQGKGIVVLITDLMEKTGFQDALRFISAQDLDVYLIHVLSQEEIDPDVSGDLKLVDCEDHDIAEVTVNRQLLDKYRQTLAAFIQEAKEFCNRRGIVYMMTSTERPIEQLVGKYMRQRGLLR